MTPEENKKLFLSSKDAYEYLVNLAKEVDGLPHDYDKNDFLGFYVSHDLITHLALSVIESALDTITGQEVESLESSARLIFNYLRIVETMQSIALTKYRPTTSASNEEYGWRIDSLRKTLCLQDRFVNKFQMFHLENTQQEYVLD